MKLNEGMKFFGPLKQETTSWIVFLGHLAVGQNQWYHFGVGAPPNLVYFSGWLGMFTGGTGF